MWSDLHTGQLHHFYRDSSCGNVHFFNENLYPPLADFPDLKHMRADPSFCQCRRSFIVASTVAQVFPSRVRNVEAETELHLNAVLFQLQNKRLGNLHAFTFNCLQDGSLLFSPARVSPSLYSQARNIFFIK